jgi:hypothetical protein
MPGGPADPVISTTLPDIAHATSPLRRATPRQA